MNHNVYKIQTALSSISQWRCEDRQQWVTVGMAIHAATDGSIEGLELWDSWSKRSQKYRQDECNRLWKGFDANGKISQGTLIFMASEDSNGGTAYHAVPPRTVRLNKRHRPVGNASKGFCDPMSGIGSLSRRHGKPVAVWEYQNCRWEPVAYAVRFNRPDGGKDIVPVSLCEDSLWRIKAMPEPRLLYRLPEILEQDISDTIYVVEGEKCADSMVRLGFMATTSSGGSNAARKSDWTFLAGRKVVIIPDNDLAGLTYAEHVSLILLGLNPQAEVKILELSNMPEKGDIYDYIVSRIGVETGNGF